MQKGLKLQTIVDIPTPPFTISEGDSVAVVGSCFAENIGSRLSLLNEEGEAERVVVNPCGIVYNPMSVARSFEIMCSGERFSESDLLERDGLFHSMEHHGKFSRASASEVLEGINLPAQESFDYIIITLGTIYTYFYKGKSVANCHKLPEKEFERRALSPSEVLSSLERIAELYPASRLIITVSPIRHLRDGLSQNSLSKATLRVAAAEFCAASPSTRVYFPSYEILIDELRDYRFTEADMCHPTEQARGYIWQRFAELYLSGSLQSLLTVKERELRRSLHRALH